LHAAVQRSHHRLTGRLLEAGADPSIADDHGRTPADWALIVRDRAIPAVDPGWVTTGIRGIDLFAPIPIGGLIRWPPAYGLGQAVAIFQIADHLQPVELWVIGFSYGGYEPAHIAHAAGETGVPATTRLAPMHAPAADRRKAFAAAVAEVLARRAVPKLVVCQEAPGFTHDITLALPALTAEPSITATFVVAPFTGTYPDVAPEPPEGYDGQVAFSVTRARAALWPAIDPATTTAKRWPSPHHRDLAATARQLLSGYLVMDPPLALPNPHELPDPDTAACAQELIRYLTQPFRIAETATSLPGERTAVPELLDTVRALLRSP
jgi:hypothetical protein